MHKLLWMKSEPIRIFGARPVAFTVALALGAFLTASSGCTQSEPAKTGISGLLSQSSSGKLEKRVNEAADLFEQTASAKEEIAALCKELASEIKTMKWSLDPCQGIDWKVGAHSVKGRPLIYGEFGPRDAINTTLIISAVHGDEITPVYVGFKLVRWLMEHPEELKDSRVVVAPLVNPDGFFGRPRTRVNSRGVDVNRNFDTSDWRQKALPAWKKRYLSDPRRFPGSVPASEPETLYQVELLKRVQPQKVLSVHSPLNFLDYDGPTSLSLAQFPKDYIQKCVQLRNRLKAVSGGFYPGSLGNYAGRELGIPTLTLELPSANPAAAEKYWRTFSQGIHTMIRFVVPAASAGRGLPASRDST